MKVCLRTLFAVLLLVQPVVWIHGSQWDITVVDGTTTEAGRFAALALDQYDMPHIAYRVENPDSLKYAWLQVTTWLKVPQDVTGMGQYNDMVLDGMDRAYISHFDPVDTRLMLTGRFNNTVLETEQADGDGYTGLYTAIDLAAGDVPTIVYYRADTNYIRCVKSNGGGWLYYTVATDADPSSIDMKIDTSDMIHVVYGDTTNRNLIYSVGACPGWTPSTIDANVQVTDCDLQLDSSGNPHIAYIDSETGDLKYAWLNGSTWTTEVALEDASAALNSVTMALDSNNVPHVCFYSMASTLVYFNRVGGSWQGDAIDDDGDVGMFCSMAIDSTGYPHVAYYDRDQKNLKYARWKTPTPTPTPTAIPQEITTKMVMDDTFMTAGETFLLERTYTNALSASTAVDEYILLDVVGLYWFWPGWTESLDFSQWTVPVGGPTTDTILTFQWPTVDGTFSGIRFWGAFLAANTSDLLSYDVIEWGYGDTPPPLTLTTTAFTNGQAIPAKYTCDDLDVSPLLSWNRPVQSISSFAMIVDDPDAPGGDWVHWVIYDIPPETQSFAEDVPADPVLDDGSVQGNNSWSTIGYRGPCPPSGSTHRYFFKLYALDTMLGLGSGAAKDELLDAMEGHVLFQTQIMGTYQR